MRNVPGTRNTFEMTRSAQTVLSGTLLVNATREKTDMEIPIQRQKLPILLKNVNISVFKTSSLGFRERDVPTEQHSKDGLLFLERC